MIVRPDRPLRENIRENLLQGRIVGQVSRGSHYTLFFKVLPDRTGRDYDLEILLPLHAHQRLGIAVGREVTVSLKKSAIHLIPTAPVAAAGQTR